MHITQLSLTNFRNYGRLELALPKGATLLYGDNAQGKTNLLEAIYYLATTRSPQAESDQQLLNWAAVQEEAPITVGRIVAEVTTAAEKRQLEMRLIREQNERLRNGYSFRREMLINRRKVRLMDALGNLRIVLFLPQDVQLISGSPSNRRRYMDITLCQIDTHYCRTLSAYNKVLEQRNALLRQLAEGLSSPDLLPIYTEKLVKLGATIFSRRAQFITALAQETERIHFEALTSGMEAVKLHYLPRLADNKAPAALQQAATRLTAARDGVQTVEKQFAQLLTETTQKDIARGATSIGPHRDDWQFEINGRSLSGFGSRGQQRSAILALKLAEIEWMSRVTGETPILLLDEVVAELDKNRRDLLLRYVHQSSQAILTGTDPTMFSASFLEKATSMQVINGQITH